MPARGGRRKFGLMASLISRSTVDCTAGLKATGSGDFEGGLLARAITVSLWDLINVADGRGGMQSLARIIHERFCCNRRSAATTCLRPAGSPLGPSPYCTSTHRGLRAPRADLATRLSNFATNRHE